jgi:hypothetical protein
MAETEFLSNLTALIKVRLQTDPYFIGPPAIPIIVEQDGDMLSRIDVNCATLGLAVVIAPLEKKAGELPGEREIPINIMIRENPKINRSTATGGTGKCASDIGEMLEARLDQWQPSDTWDMIQYVGMIYEGEGRALDADGKERGPIQRVWTVEFKIGRIQTVTD